MADTIIRDGKVEEFNDRYRQIGGKVLEQTSVIKAQNQEIVKSQTKEIYKHYLKQGLKYVLSGAVIVLGGLMLFSPASLAFIPGMTALGSALGGALLPVLGTGVTLLGVYGGLRTRLNRNLEFSVHNDRKRLNFLWREARRIKRIERDLAKAQRYMKTDVHKASFLRKRALNEIKIYENNSFGLYREAKRDLKTRTQKSTRPNKLRDSLSLLGINRLEDVDDIRLEQLHKLSDAGLMQLKNADALRKEAGFEQNQKVVDLFEEICEQIKEKDTDVSQEIRDAITTRQKIKSCKASTVYREAIEEMLNNDKLDKAEFDKNMLEYSNAYGLDGEDILKECIKHNYGKRNAVAVISTVLGNADIKELSEKTQIDLENRSRKMKDKERDGILNILAERAESQEGKEKEATVSLSNRLEDCIVPTA